MTNGEAKKLAQALKKHFGGKVEFEAVNGQGRYRFAISSRRFNGMTQLKRQDAVWAVVDEVLKKKREATLGISMILTFVPAELAAAK